MAPRTQIKMNVLCTATSFDVIKPDKGIDRTNLDRELRKKMNDLDPAPVVGVNLPAGVRPRNYYCSVELLRVNQDGGRTHQYMLYTMSSLYTLKQKLKHDGYFVYPHLLLDVQDPGTFQFKFRMYERKTLTKKEIARSLKAPASETATLDWPNHVMVKVAETESATFQIRVAKKPKALEVSSSLHLSLINSGAKIRMKAQPMRNSRKRKADSHQWSADAVTLGAPHPGPAFRQLHRQGPAALAYASLMPSPLSSMVSARTVANMNTPVATEATNMNVPLATGAMNMNVPLATGPMNMNAPMATEGASMFMSMYTPMDLAGTNMFVPMDTAGPGMDTAGPGMGMGVNPTMPPMENPVGPVMEWGMPMGPGMGMGMGAELGPGMGAGVTMGMGMGMGNPPYMPMGGINTGADVTSAMATAEANMFAPMNVDAMSTYGYMPVGGMSTGANSALPMTTVDGAMFASSMDMGGAMPMADSGLPPDFPDFGFEAGMGAMGAAEEEEFDYANFWKSRQR